MLRALTFLFALFVGHSCAFTTSSTLSLRTTNRPQSVSALSMKVDILQKVETLKVLTAVSKSGLLSKIEKAGLLSKLEKDGVLSKVEKLLPLLDQYQAISLLNKAVNIEPIALTTAALLILLVDGAVVAAVPDSSTELIAVQIVVSLLAVLAVAPLFIGAQLLTIIQGSTPLTK